jgi:hypothetical protein
LEQRFHDLVILGSEEKGLSKAKCRSEMGELARKIRHLKTLLE